jgi:tetratricopeptide (TPR) repeat protein
MRLSLLFAASIGSVIIAGCGPAVNKEYLYLAREGDTVRALTLRLTGNEKPAKLIAGENELGVDTPLPPNNVLHINSKTVIKNMGYITVLEDYNEARAKLLRYDFSGARALYEKIHMTPNDPAVVYEKAICDYLSGDFNSAYVEPAGNDGSFSAILSACCDSAASDLPAAEDKLLARLLNEPGDRRSKYLLGEVMRRQKRYPEARDAYFGLLLDNEDNIIAELTRAAVKRATREEMNEVKERIETENANKKH